MTTNNDPVFRLSERIKNISHGFCNPQHKSFNYISLLLDLGATLEVFNSGQLIILQENLHQINELLGKPAVFNAFYWSIIYDDDITGESRQIILQTESTDECSASYLLQEKIECTEEEVKLTEKYVRNELRLYKQFLQEPLVNVKFDSKRLESRNAKLPKAIYFDFQNRYNSRTFCDLLANLQFQLDGNITPLFIFSDISSEREQQVELLKDLFMASPTLPVRNINGLQIILGIAVSELAYVFEYLSDKKVLKNWRQPLGQAGFIFSSKTSPLPISYNSLNKELAKFRSWTDSSKESYDDDYNQYYKRQIKLTLDQLLKF